MTSKEAVKLAYKEFQKDFEDGEAINQWLTNVIDGLKQAEKDLELLEILLASFLKKSMGEGTQPNTTILLDGQSYDKIKELLENEIHKEE